MRLQTLRKLKEFLVSSFIIAFKFQTHSETTGTPPWIPFRARHAPPQQRECYEFCQYQFRIGLPFYRLLWGTRNTWSLSGYARMYNIIVINVEFLATPPCFKKIQILDHLIIQLITNVLAVVGQEGARQLCLLLSYHSCFPTTLSACRGSKYTSWQQ